MVDLGVAGVPVCVVHSLDEDWGGDVAGVQLGPDGDLLQERWQTV